MITLQPAEWPKPRGFSHGITVDGPGKWIVLAGQTGVDDKGQYQADMAGQVGVALQKSSSFSQRLALHRSISCA